MLLGLVLLQRRSLLRPVLLQICRDVARRAPTLAPAELCIGELAIAVSRKGLALRAFERARVLAPGERAVWEMVGRLYVDRLSDLVVDERTGDLDGALARPPLAAWLDALVHTAPAPAPSSLASARWMHCTDSCWLATLSTRES